MNLKIGDLSMKSAIADASRHVYRLVEGKDRRWLVKQGPFPADNIYLLEDGRGMGGALITFKLENGNEVHIRGPWLSNPGELFDDTGLDLRDKLSTFVVLAEDLFYCDGDKEPTLTNIVYKDEIVQESLYSRGRDLALHFANQKNRKIYFYQQTAGGSLLGSVVPDTQETLT